VEAGQEAEGGRQDAEEDERGQEAERQWGGRSDAYGADLGGQRVGCRFAEFSGRAADRRSGWGSGAVGTDDGGREWGGGLVEG
jgi:hypothetical protein